MVVCGETLYAGAAGIPLYGLPLDPSLGTISASAGKGRPLLLRVSDSCEHGSTVSITPAGIAYVALQVDATDGLAAAVAVVGEANGRATLSAYQGGHLVGTAPLVVDQGP